MIWGVLPLSCCCAPGLFLSCPLEVSFAEKQLVLTGPRGGEWVSVLAAMVIRYSQRCCPRSSQHRSNCLMPLSHLRSVT